MNIKRHDFLLHFCQRNFKNHFWSLVCTHSPYLAFSFSLWFTYLSLSFLHFLAVSSCSLCSISLYVYAYISLHNSKRFWFIVKRNSRLHVMHMNTITISKIYCRTFHGNFQLWRIHISFLINVACNKWSFIMNVSN